MLYFFAPYITMAEYITNNFKYPTIVIIFSQSLYFILNLYLLHLKLLYHILKAICLTLNKFFWLHLIYFDLELIVFFNFF